MRPIILRLLIVISLPFVLTMLVVRLVTLPWYPAWEYSKRDFPPDPLKMARDDRLRIARITIHFLNLPRGSGLLDDMRLPNGDIAFNDRELVHMEDVKMVYDRLTRLALLLALVAGLSAWALGRWDSHFDLWGAFSDAGLLTISLLVSVGIWMSLGFDAFFTAFHGVFFTGDSWLFRYDDTLIRLFPIKFWSDAGFLIAGIVGAIALGLALVGRALQKRQAKSMATDSNSTRDAK